MQTNTQRTIQDPVLPALYDTQTAADYLGVKKNTLEIWRLKGYGPVFIKIGQNVRYRTIDLAQWIESQVRSSTSDTGA